MYKIFTLLIFAVVTQACTATQHQPTMISPFGVWESNCGQELTIYLNGAYKICRNADCEMGSYTRAPHTHLTVTLNGLLAKAPMANIVDELREWQNVHYRQIPEAFGDDVEVAAIIDSVEFDTGVNSGSEHHGSTPVSNVAVHYELEGVSNVVFSKRSDFFDPAAAAELDGIARMWRSNPPPQVILD